jgi:hypothetical protein
MNYRHIDYFQVEGKTADGKSFIIKNITELPTNCNFSSPNYVAYNSCIANLVKHNFTDPSTQAIGTIRQDYLGRNWTKVGNEHWTSPSEPGIGWGDIMWYETDKDVYQYHEEQNKCGELRDKEPYERKCELRFNLDNAEWTSGSSKKSFWQSIACFFKSFFGRSC